VLPQQAREYLAGDLPAALLVTGPGAGKVVLDAFAERHWAHWWSAINAAAAREIIDEAWLASDGERVTVLDMDGASVQVQNMLLKVLEEPPAGNRFVLTAAGPLLETVESRCQVLTVGAPSEAAAPDSKDVLAVGSAVRAAKAGNSVQLARMVRDWTPAHVQLLAQWAAEAAAGRWRVFSESTVPGVRPEQALRVLQELAARGSSRLAPVVALQASFPSE